MITVPRRRLLQSTRPATIAITINVNIDVDKTFLFLAAVIWSLWIIGGDSIKTSRGIVSDLGLAVGSLYCDLVFMLWRPKAAWVML